VPQLLRSADVFVMPSHSEGLGNAALEAAATGLVVVLADVSGLRDLRRVANLGIWTGTDPQSIAEGLREGLALAASATWEDRQKQHEAVTDVYGSRRGIEEYAALYRRLASSAVAGDG
jgi:glycosyltransferase involved in cell wall biosynthesis